MSKRAEEEQQQQQQQQQQVFSHYNNRVIDIDAVKKVKLTQFFLRHFLRVDLKHTKDWDSQPNTITAQL